MTLYARRSRALGDFCRATLQATCRDVCPNAFLAGWNMEGRQTDVGSLDRLLTRSGSGFRLFCSQGWVDSDRLQRSVMRLFSSNELKRIMAHDSLESAEHSFKYSTKGGGALALTLRCCLSLFRCPGCTAAVVWSISLWNSWENL